MAKCNYSHIDFKGMCPIEECVAFIGNKHPTGCFHCLFPNNGSLEIRRAFNIEKSEIKVQTKTLLILSYLYHLKNLCETENQCISCGMTGTKLCNNEEDCDKRKFFCEKIISRYPHNILNTSVQQYWGIIKLRKKIKKDFSIQEILHIDEEEFLKSLILFKKGINSNNHGEKHE